LNVVLILPIQTQPSESVTNEPEVESNEESGEEELNAILSSLPSADENQQSKKRKRTTQQAAKVTKKHKRKDIK
jgi:hypothetical protein